MKTSKQRWYLPGMMHRAGKPKHFFDCGLLVMTIVHGEMKKIAWCKRFVLTRDGQGIPKEVARLTADIEPHRLSMVAAIAEKDSDSVVERINQHIKAMQQQVRVRPEGAKMIFREVARK